MRKPSLLYASPFPPIKSGISEYSSILVKELSKDFEITLYTDDYRITDPSLSSFKVIRNGRNAVHFEKFDYCIYNMGNQPDYHGYIYRTAMTHPGYIILHDFSLYYLFAGYHQKEGDLYTSIYLNEGVNCLKEITDYKRRNHVFDLLSCKSLAAEWPMNREILSSGSKIIVHSEYAKNKVISSGCVQEEDVLQIGMIHQIEQDTTLINKEKLYKKYHIPSNITVIAAFGIIAETKLNRETIKAIEKLQNENQQICYIMVGEGNYVDDLLKREQIIKTGFVNIDEFNSFMEYADIVVNLRYPSRGETSAALMRALEKGKACLTNNGGWFSEVPDNCVYKIDLLNVEEEIYAGLKLLITDHGKKETIQKEAKDYAQRVGSPERICASIRNFMENSNLK